ncbi:MAG: FAD-binding and (Fe-S)-binding domain-containing protein [Wenzhouxiangella sp.]
MPTLHRDSLTRHLYAVDASMYQEVPAAVCFPTDADDLAELIIQARTEGLGITLRAAGTSLAGQTTGGGIVADISRHMTAIVGIDPVRRRARVQPGVIRDQLNRAAAEHGLLFGPDTSTTNRCMLGGMIGNNASGSYSPAYATTREHVISLDCLLDDGSRARFGPLAADELDAKCRLDSREGEIYRQMLGLLTEHKTAIEAAYPHPEVTRRNTGYALDLLCRMAPLRPDGPPFNLAALLTGSEGTLAVTVEAELNLEPLKAHRALVVPHFDSLDAAMRATVAVLDLAPAAVELVDRHILEATRANRTQRRNRFFLQGEPDCLLVIEFLDDDPDQARQRAEAAAEALVTATAAPVFTDPDEMARVWEVRKAGLGLLMGRVSDEKSPTFVEDTAVRVADLPDYVRDFQALMARHGTDCVFYGHAASGELHLRPVLDLRQPEGLVKMKTMAQDVAELVRDYRGSLSGEHGDGLARAQFLPTVLGPEMVGLLEQVKQIWDPDGLFNPGKIVFAPPMDRNLRYHPDWRPAQVETVFRFRESNGFAEAIERCNGAGACRKLDFSGGGMCPSYRASLDEKDTTRGRANLLRQMFTGEDPAGFRSVEVREALEFCLGCKACKSECPASVDMAALKAEFLNGWIREHGASLADRFYGQPMRLYPLASRFTGLSNAWMRSRLGKWMLQRLIGIHPARRLPPFAARPFHRQSVESVGMDNRPVVVLLVDYFINYHEPQIAQGAVRVLEALGFAVRIEAPFAAGRTLISRGLLDQARALAERNLDLLEPHVAAGHRIVGLEPSETLALRDEYLDFFDGRQHARAERLAGSVQLFEELVAGHAPEALAGVFAARSEAVLVHGNCHAKALVGEDALIKSLEIAGYRPERLATGCCGMAGSFGYDKKKYKMSMAIAEQKLFPSLRRQPDTLVCAHGFSCRHQIHDGLSRQARHPAELLAAVLRE